MANPAQDAIDRLNQRSRLQKKSKKVKKDLVNKSFRISPKKWDLFKSALKKDGRNVQYGVAWLIDQYVNDCKSHQ